MKRMILFLLAAGLLCPLAGCEKTSPPLSDPANEVASKESVTENAPLSEEDTTETSELEAETENGGKEEVGFAKVCDPLTPEKLAAIPIAESDMTFDRLRQICVEYFCLQVSFAWTPKEDTNYVVESQMHPVSYKKGKLYGGIPYVNLGSGNLYRILDYYDPEQGVLDTLLLTTNKDIFGAACSGAACTAWARVVNSASLSYSSGFTPKAGFLPLGDYQTDYEISTFGTNDKKIDVKDIIALNTKDVMFESYALLQPADGVVSGGHVRMAKERAVVVRNEDGTINGKESFCVFVEQGCFCSGEAHTRTQEDGTSYQIQGNDNLKVTFEELYKGYIPFTFAEFLGTDPVEKSEVTLSNEEENLSFEDLARITGECNYIVTDLYCTVTDENDNEVFRYAFRPKKHYNKNFDFAKVCIPSMNHIRPFADKEGYSLSVSAQISTGERPILYKGPIRF